MTKQKYYSMCTIMRVVEVEHFRFTGDDLVLVPTYKETKTEQHGTPLFTDAETSTGICRSCQRGWEVEGNIFASEEERARAKAADILEQPEPLIIPDDSHANPAPSLTSGWGAEDAHLDDSDADEEDPYGPWTEEREYE